jgi:LmbE family N-acetylglucosaminyl deacetylase
MENELDKKQTAVQWFIEQLEEKGVAYENVSFRKIQISIDVSDYLDLKRQAKQMEKEQIENAYEIGFADAWDDARYDDEPTYIGAEQYYEQTYGGKTFIDLVSDEESKVHEVVRKLKEKRIK